MCQKLDKTAKVLPRVFVISKRLIPRDTRHVAKNDRLRETRIEELYTTIPQRVVSSLLVKPKSMCGLAKNVLTTL